MASCCQPSATDSSVGDRPFPVCAGSPLTFQSVSVDDMRCRTPTASARGFVHNKSPRTKNASTNISAKIDS